MVPDFIAVCFAIISSNGVWFPLESPNHAALGNKLECKNSFAMTFTVLDFGFDRERHGKLFMMIG